MRRGAKKNANQHNTRHENGVVAPGKRISRNGHLNGSVDGKTKEVIVSATPPDSHPPFLASGNDAAASGTYGTGLKQEQNKSLTEAISEELDGLDVRMEQNHRRIDVNYAKSASTHDGGAIQFAMTVLRSCPLRDTLSILIFLLSLPPTVLSLTNAIFALLTFVPPVGSFSSFQLSDITSSFSPGSPSFTVIVVLDVLAVLFWLMVPWYPVQAILLECAQATVATTLGGGYTNRPGVSDNTLLCVMIVFATHLGRYKTVALRVLSNSVLRKWVPVVESFDLGSGTESYLVSSNRSWLETFKVWIALHILCQGVTRTIRRFIYSSMTVKAPDVDTDLAEQPQSPMLKSKSSLQNLREVREKISSGKRRRKQANYVRSHQPLWAAFAATKATVMREYEQSQAKSDASGSNATDSQNFGSAPFASDENAVWITILQASSFFFDTGPLSCDCNEDYPFYVRINGASWASVRILAVPGSEDAEGRLRWTGEVYGLSAANTYQVSFANCEDGTVIHSEVVATPSSPIAEQASSLSTLRPSSPASPSATLKTSIAAFESSLNDTLAQQRRVRKDYRSTSLALRKEIDSLSEKSSKTSNSDKGLQARQLQYSQHIRQAEDAITSFTEELDSYAAVPEEDTRQWNEQKASWDIVRKEQSRAREDLFRTKEQNSRSQTAIQAEALSARQKKERLQHRATKLSNQHKRLNVSTLSEKGRSNSDHTKASERYQAESIYQEQVNALNREFQDVTFRYRTMWQQCQTLEAAAEQAAILSQAQARLQYESRPITPEGDLPGTNPANAINRFASFGTPELQHVTMANGHGGVANGTPWDGRARSTSVLSGNSVYEDFDDDEDFLPVVAKRISGMGSVKEGKEGSGSGSGSGGGSPHLKYRGKQSPRIG